MPGKGGRVPRGAAGDAGAPPAPGRPGSERSQPTHGRRDVPFKVRVCFILFSWFKVPLAAAAPCSLLCSAVTGYRRYQTGNC